MTVGKLIEMLTDICEPYKEGDPDLYDLPVYINGEPVLVEMEASGIKILPAEEKEDIPEDCEPLPDRIYIKP